MRHEQFNGMLKGVGCLYQRFRHSDARFKTCFEAVSVICQYRVEHGDAAVQYNGRHKYMNIYADDLYVYHC
jgi:hypothetical protein